MAKEQKRRPPVFQDATTAPEPIQIDPPFQSAQEEASDVIQSDIEEAAIAVEEGSDVSLGPTAEGTWPIPEDDLPSGWKLITEAQQNGAHFFVTHDFACEGTEAFWRKTRVLSHFKWVSRGKWSNSLTRQDVLPEPRFYKELAK